MNYEPSRISQFREPPYESGVVYRKLGNAPAGFALVVGAAIIHHNDGPNKCGGAYYKFSKPITEGEGAPWIG